MRPNSCVLTLLLALAFQATARDLHYGSVTDPALRECDALEWRGQRRESRPCYRNLLSGAATPAVKAEAAWALGDLKDANSRFEAAARVAPEDAGVRVRWGSLYLQTHQYQIALDLFDEALKLDPGNAFANLGAARALANRFEAPAAKYLDAVLSDDGAPEGARFAALLLAARLALEDGDLNGARQRLADADEVATRADLTRLELLALRAALDWLQDDEDSDWIATALQQNRHYGDVHAIPAHFAWINRRYREAERLYAQAISIQPDHWLAHLELGVNLLRRNQVERAREHLEIAYEGDPFNPKTVNTLRLLDSFAAYELIDYPAKRSSGTPPTLTLRVHRDERAVLAGYARRLAADGLTQFSSRYRFATTEPVVVEIYPNHDDFVVRTTGMPGLGILGVAFGYVVALDSPSAHPAPDYHWGTTLWHELAHVYTLEMTNHRVPRWVSEGISVYEEWRSGPTPGMRIPAVVFEAIKRNKLLPVAELDRGFIRPDYAEQVQVSYTQAGLICEFIDREYGFGAILALLREFPRGADTRLALESALDMPVAAFDERFLAFIDTEFGDVVDKLDVWTAARAASLDSLARRDWDAAQQSAARAIAIHPRDVESGSPYLTLASAYAESGAPDREVEILETYWRKGGYAPAALRRLAERLHAAGRTADANSVLASLIYVTPFDQELHGRLGDWLLEAGRAADALTEYEILLSMKPHDRADAHYRIARAHAALDDPDATRRHLLLALDIAPHYRPAQKLLLELNRK